MQVVDQVVEQAAEVVDHRVWVVMYLRVTLMEFTPQCRLKAETWLAVTWRQSLTRLIKPKHGQFQCRQGRATIPAHHARNTGLVPLPEFHKRENNQRKRHQHHQRNSAEWKDVDTWTFLGAIYSSVWFDVYIWVVLAVIANCSWLILEHHFIGCTSIRRAAFTQRLIFILSWSWSTNRGCSNPLGHCTELWIYYVIVTFHYYEVSGHFNMELGVQWKICLKKIYSCFGTILLGNWLENDLFFHQQ